MSWHFSQALVGAYSAGICSAGGLSAPSSPTPMPAMYFWPARTTDVFRPSRSGMTCGHLMADRGEALLTWCLEDSRVRISRLRAEVLGSGVGEAASGARWRALLVKFSPDSCSWKTVRGFWSLDLDWSYLTLPRWGSMHGGELWERATPALPTRGTVSGFWATPQASDGREAVSTYGKSLRNGKDIPELGTVEGWINPVLSEWLMGWPLGWTDCAVSETVRYRLWQRWHGIS